MILRIIGDTVVTDDAMIRADFLVHDGTISALSGRAVPVEGVGETIDGTNLLVLPGGVDVHTHAYDPDPNQRERNHAFWRFRRSDPH